MWYSKRLGNIYLGQIKRLCRVNSRNSWGINYSITTMKADYISLNLMSPPAYRPEIFFLSGLLTLSFIKFFPSIILFFFQILFEDIKSTWFIITKQDHRPSVNYSSKQLELLLTFVLTFIIYKKWFINLGLKNRPGHYSLSRQTVFFFVRPNKLIFCCM